MSLKWIINLTFLMRVGMFIFMIYDDFVLINLIRTHIKKGKDLLTISIAVLFIILFAYVFKYDLGPNPKSIPLWIPILFVVLLIFTIFLHFFKKKYSLQDEGDLL